MRIRLIPFGLCGSAGDLVVGGGRVAGTETQQCLEGGHVRRHWGAGGHVHHPLAPAMPTAAAVAVAVGIRLIQMAIERLFALVTRLLARRGDPSG